VLLLLLVLVCCCRFIDHGRYEDQIAEAGLSASHIASTALSVLGKAKDAQLTLSGIGV
jgi:1-deoxy-D-xylulose-5-phosphate synthase